MKKMFFEEVLARLEATGAQSASQLVKHHGRSRKAIDGALARLRKAGLAHLAKFVPQPNGWCGGPMALYMPGPGKEPEKRLLQDEVLESLRLIGDMSTAELAIHHSRRHSNINGAIRRLKALNLVHVARYERQPEGTQGGFILLYGAGPGEDAARPKPVSHNMVARKSAARHRRVREARHRPNTYAQLGPWKGLM